MRSQTLRRSGLEVVAVLIAAVVFIVPFVFMFLTAAKDSADAEALTFSLPKSWPIVNNIKEVFSANDNQLVTAFRNSIILTVVSVTVLVCTLLLPE